MGLIVSMGGVLLMRPGCRGEDTRSNSLLTGDTNSLLRGVSLLLVIPIETSENFIGGDSLHLTETIWSELDIEDQDYPGLDYSSSDLGFSYCTFNVKGKSILKLSQLCVVQKVNIKQIVFSTFMLTYSWHVEM